MRNENQSPRVFLQEPFQPGDGRNIQVVGGLIEQKQLRLGRQCPSQQDLAPKPDDKFSKRSSGSRDNRVSTVATWWPCGVLRVSAGRPLGRIAGSGVVFCRRACGPKPAATTSRTDPVRPCGKSWQGLPRKSLSPGDPTAVRRELALYQPQQRGFTLAVAADKGTLSPFSTCRSTCSSRSGPPKLTLNIL